MSGNEDKTGLLSLVTQIVVAKISNSSTGNESLPDLIKDVYTALVESSNRTVDATIKTEKLQPAVPIKRSVFPDYIVCLEDGKKLKMLKRHLQSAYGMTPEQYREKWGLPLDYPLVAPNYAQRRSELAREIGLGRSIGAAADNGHGGRQSGRRR